MLKKIIYGTAKFREPFYSHESKNRDDFTRKRLENFGLKNDNYKCNVITKVRNKSFVRIYLLLKHYEGISCHTEEIKI